MATAGALSGQPLARGQSSTVAGPRDPRPAQGIRRDYPFVDRPWLLAEIPPQGVLEPPRARSSVARTPDTRLGCLRVRPARAASPGESRPGGFGFHAEGSGEVVNLEVATEVPNRRVRSIRRRRGS